MWLAKLFDTINSGRFDQQYYQNIMFFYISNHDDDLSETSDTIGDFNQQVRSVLIGFDDGFVDTCKLSLE